MHCGNFIRIVAHGPLGNNSQSEHIIQQMNPAKTKDQARLGEHGPLILTSFPSFPGLESLGEGGGGRIRMFCTGMLPQGSNIYLLTKQVP